MSSVGEKENRMRKGIENIERRESKEEEREKKEKKKRKGEERRSNFYWSLAFEQQNARRVKK